MASRLARLHKNRQAFNVALVQPLKLYQGRIKTDHQSASIPFVQTARCTEADLKRQCKRG